MENKSLYQRLKEYVETHRDLIVQDQIDRFHNKLSGDLFSIFVEKVILKYESESYRERYFNRSMEPTESLYWFLYKYAIKYGSECDNDEYNSHGNMFTSGLYYINGYYFNQMDGQGSIIKIIKK